MPRLHPDTRQYLRRRKRLETNPTRQTRRSIASWRTAARIGSLIRDSEGMPVMRVADRPPNLPLSEQVAQDASGFIVSLPSAVLDLTATVTAVSLGLRFSFRYRDHFFVDVGASLPTLGGWEALYSILAAFTVYVVWNQFNELDEAIEAEVEDLFDLYRYTVYLRDDQALSQVGEAIQRYCQYVVEQEWHGMATGKIHELSTATFEDIFAVVHNVKFDDERDIAAWSESRKSRRFGRQAHETAGGRPEFSCEAAPLVRDFGVLCSPSKTRVIDRAGPRQRYDFTRVVEVWTIPFVAIGP